MADLVSIIVPIYNVERYLERCIKSLISQTYEKIEIILVDDGSPDNCSLICDEWKKKDKRIKVIHKKNGGLSDARNAGLRIAAGSYIIFVDSDDWVEPNMIDVMLSELQKNNADTCACGIFYNYPEKETIRVEKYTVGDSLTFLEKLYDDAKYPVCAWNKLYKKKLLSNFEFPVGKICEDAFTTYKLIDKANRIVQINIPLYHYSIRENSIMTVSFKKNRMDEEEAWRKNYEFVEKNYPEIKYKAFDFYLQRVLGLIKVIPKNKRNNEFQKEYKYLKKILRHNCFYIIFKSSTVLKFKIRFIIDYLKL